MINPRCCCGLLYSNNHANGDADYNNNTCLCGLLSCSKGSNKFATFISSLFLRNGFVCAKGEHKGCGCTVARLGIFCGPHKQACETFCWESGHRDY